MDQAMIDTEGLGALGRSRALVADGYRVIGPTVSGDAIVLAEITDAAQLPAGWKVETGGCCRLQQRDDGAMFGTRPGRSRGRRSCTRRAPGSGRRTPRRQSSEPAGPLTVTRYSASGCDLAAIGSCTGCWPRAPPERDLRGRRTDLDHRRGLHPTR